MFLRPDLSTFRVLPGTQHTGERIGRLICDIHNPDGSPFEGCPRHALKRAIARAATRRLRDALRARGRVLPVPDAGRPGDHRHPRRRRLLRPGAGRPRRGRAPADRPGARVDRHRRRGGAPRGRRRPARDRLPPGRRAGHRRQRQHLPLHRQERRAAERPARHVHAQAGLRPRTAPACTCCSRCVGRRRPERLPRPRRAVAVEPHLPQLHRRPAAPRQGLLLDHQPAGELLQAAGARLRGADQHRLVGAQPQPAGPRPGAARRRDRRRAARPRSVVQPVPRARGHAVRRARRASTRTSIPARRSTRTSTR